MMTDTGKLFISAYIAAFSDYVAHGQEAALGRAYELGREALAFNSGLFVITASHHEALNRALSLPNAKSSDQIIKRAGEFLAESLSPFEMATRGFQESITVLNNLNTAFHRQQKDLRLLLSPIPNLLLTLDKQDCLAALFVPSNFPPILKSQKVGTALADVLPSELVEPIITASLAVRQSNQVHRLECPLMVNGQMVYFDLQVSPVDDSQNVLLVIDDITERKEIEIAEQQQRILAESLRDIAIALGSSLDLDEVLNRIVVSIGRVVPHDTANIMLVEAMQAHIVRSFGYRIHHLDDYENKITNLLLSPDVTPTLHQVIESRQTVIVVDLAAKKRDHIGLGLSGSAVSAPIMVGDSIIGVINLNSFTTGFFTAVHAENLQIFANQAAVAIENARLFEQAQEAATLKERQRLARDLHDSVTQSLFSASVITESLISLLKRDPDKASSLLVDLHRIMKGTLAEMRVLLLELRPSSLVSTTLDKLLDQLVTVMRGQTKMTLVLTADVEPQLPEDVHLGFYRIAQEALNNVVKHSRATNVNLQLYCVGETTVLCVQDDGQGFDSAKTSSGLGLNNMRERAEIIEGLLKISSQPGQGTEIMLSWEPSTTGQ
jgi:signal transduction histidine kinase